VSETFGYDTRSRMTTWTTSSPATTRTFSYDGAGRLRKVARTGNGPANEVYYYHVDDQIPYEVRTAGAVTTHLYRHGVWGRRATTPTVYTDTEQLLPMLAVRGTERVVRLVEQTQEGLGAFGSALSKYNSPPPLAGRPASSGPLLAGVDGWRGRGATGAHP
jgi:hypothetical protein